MKLRILIAAFLGLGLVTACDNKPDTPGEVIDQTIEDTEDAIDDAADNMSDAAEDVADTMEEEFPQ